MAINTTLVLIMTALLMLLTGNVQAEKIEFSYTIDPKTTICFLESINDGV